MSKLIDLTSKKFGKLTVIRRNHDYVKVVRWDCKCECGNTKTIRGSSLKDGSTKSCGCLAKKRNIGKRKPEQAKKHIGKKFNRLTIIDIERKTNGYGGYYVITKCDCGNITKNVYADLKNEKVYSCGCYGKEQQSKTGSLVGLNNGTVNCSKRKWGVEKDGKFVKMRSGFEVMFAMILEKENIQWDYEPKRFKLSNGLRYTPDFYLPEQDLWIDVKGQITEKHKNKHKLFRKLGYNLDLVLIDELKERLDMSYYMFKKQWDIKAKSDNVETPRMVAASTE